MDREQAIALLPSAYAIALSLRDQGVPVDDIARELSIDPDATATFFAVAESKLAAIQARAK
jgi:hypothetical protein